MASYVRVRDPELLQKHVRAAGTTQIDLAARVGLSPQRFSQLVTGAGPVIRAVHAAAIEDALGVPRRTLFVAEESALIRDYLDDQDPEPPACA